MILRIIDLIALISFMVTIPIVIHIQSFYFYYSDYASSFVENSPSMEQYDFIVVGGGSAGSVVANRLSKNSKVLLLEAGGNPLYHNSIPLLAVEMLSKPQVTRMYKTVPQKYSQFAMENKQAKWPRGIVLGGSSVLNYMFYVRGHKYDYDNWANMTGDSSWNYDNVLPYFKKSLIYRGKFAENEMHYGSTPYGFQYVEDKNTREMYQHVKGGMEELGYKEVDLNGPQETGFSHFESTTKNGARSSTYSAFLEPILGRKNLRIVKYAQVTKVQIDSMENTRGVWYIRHGKKQFARASKEVILSAGSIDSPKILLLSGIGPKQHLRDIGIKPKVDLPVGKNLKDHIGFFMTPFSMNTSVTFKPERDFKLKTFLDYYLHGTGPLTCPTLLNAVAFLSSTLAKKSHGDWPDIELYFSFAGIYGDLGKDISGLTGAKREIVDKYFNAANVQDGISIGVTLVRPKSTGDLRLPDKNPESWPLIDPKYFEHPDDIKVIVEASKIAMNLLENTDAYKQFDTKFTEIPLPGCEQHKLKSDAYYQCYARHLGFTIFHPVGTCKMGKGVQDPTAVVDTQLRVLKVKALRVVDCSIMPEIVNGNTNAPAIMIGEKGADLIRQYWSEQNLICDKMTAIFNPLSTLSKCFYARLF